MTWTQEDETTRQLLERELGGQLIEIIEHGGSVTDQAQNDDGIDWGAVDDGTPHDNPVTNYPAPAPVAYPEPPTNPHEHPYTITMKGGSGYDAPWVVIHANTASECIGKLNELETYGFYPALGVANSALVALTRQMLQAAAPPAPPAPAPAPPQGAVNYNPSTPPPNQPYAGQPAWQQAGAPAQQWAPGPPQQQYGGQQNAKPDPSPQPPGWWKVNGRSGPGFDAWKAMREQQKDYVKGKIKWAGNSDYWIDPSLGPWLAQQGFAVNQ